MNPLLGAMDALAQNIADGRDKVSPEDYMAFWHDLGLAGDYLFGNDQEQGYRELDYLRLRLAEARRADTQRRKADARAVAVVEEYKRQLSEHGNDEAATLATAQVLGMSLRSVYRARSRVGTQVAIPLSSPEQHK